MSSFTTAMLKHGKNNSELSGKNIWLDVFIYYDGERIIDIHSLFKWGKVKHGSTILFAIRGDDIQDVAKLQRYLRQGASPNSKISFVSQSTRFWLFLIMTLK